MLHLRTTQVFCAHKIQVPSSALISFGRMYSEDSVLEQYVGFGVASSSTLRLNFSINALGSSARHVSRVWAAYSIAKETAPCCQSCS
jgi:hypothetical protein